MPTLTKSETNNAIIVRLRNVRPHSNADRLKIASVLGTQVVVGIDSKENDLVIYFDSNLRLSPTYLAANNLYANAELNSDPTKKGYFGSNGRVKSQKFRGEISNGYVAEIGSLIPTNAINSYDDLDLQEGDEFTHVNGVEICDKYIIPQNMPGQPGSRNRTRRNRIPRSDMFKRHWDTKQLMREIYSIPHGMVWIEEKVHGTSGRTGHVLVNTNRPWWKFWMPKQVWKVMSGTRKMDHIEGHIPNVRKQIHDSLAPFLRKGETVYYEIFGHDVTGKEIQKGFHYGCVGGEYKVMLYRVTITTPDNYTYDLPREAVYHRAGELCLMKPILLHKDIRRIGASEDELLADTAKELAIGNSAIANHIKEGVVVWFMNADGTWSCLKHKSEEFLMLESSQRDENIGDVEDSL